MTRIDVALFGSDHGGLIDASPRGDVFRGYDHTRLVRVMRDDWPHLFVMTEGDYYEYFGGMGMWGAIEAMRYAGSRPYAPLLCGLPRQWGPFAPVIFYDAQALIVKRWWDHRAPDFSARNRNVLRVKPFEGGEEMWLATGHGDINEPLYRAADAKGQRWLANEDILSVITYDFNEPLSGPHHEPKDLDDQSIPRKAWRFLHRLRHHHGVPERPTRLVTQATDYLCGWWDYKHSKRVGGIGFRSVAELQGIYTGTNLPKFNNRQEIQIDHILVNRPMAQRLVPGSVRIHEPIDPENPDSDHKRESATFEL